MVSRSCCESKGVKLNLKEEDEEEEEEKKAKKKNSKLKNNSCNSIVFLYGPKQILSCYSCSKEDS